MTIVLYSTNTLLAHRINERYYGGFHYVWCTPCFSSSTDPRSRCFVPPTSAPRDIYFSLLKEVRAGDRHSSKIRENKLGIVRGATLKHKGGVITEDQLKEIKAIVAKSETVDFLPLFYVIPYQLVSGIVQSVPVHKRASPTADEYIIDKLPSNCFDVIDLSGA